jgi:hypothetical protein
MTDHDRYSTDDHEAGEIAAETGGEPTGRRRWLTRGGIVTGGVASLAVGAVLGGIFQGIPVLLPHGHHNGALQVTSRAGIQLAASAEQAAYGTPATAAGVVAALAPPAAVPLSTLGAGPTSTAATPSAAKSPVPSVAAPPPAPIVMATTPTPTTPAPNPTSPTPEPSPSTPPTTVQQDPPSQPGLVQQVLNTTVAIVNQTVATVTGTVGPLPTIPTLPSAPAPSTVTAPITGSGSTSSGTTSTSSTSGVVSTVGNLGGAASGL